MPDDADYQKKLFTDQYKLLMDNYQYYKMKILANDDFINETPYDGMTDDIRNGKFYDENYHHVSRRQA